MTIGIESRQIRFVTELAARLLLPSGTSLPIRHSVFMFVFLQWRICFSLFTRHSIPAGADLLSFIRSSHYSFSGGSAFIYSVFTLFLAVADLLSSIHSSLYSCSGGSAFLYSLVTLLSVADLLSFIQFSLFLAVADLLSFICSSFYSSSGGSGFLYSLFALFLQWRICFPLLALP